MTQEEKKIIIDEIERLKNLVNSVNETTDEPTRFKKLIQRLKEEAEGFRCVRDINEKDAKKTISREWQYFHEAKAIAYSIAVKAILQVIEDFNGKDM